MWASEEVEVQLSATEGLADAEGSSDDACGRCSCCCLLSDIRVVAAMGLKDKACVSARAARGGKMEVGMEESSLSWKTGVGKRPLQVVGAAGAMLEEGYTSLHFFPLHSPLS